MNQRRYIGFMLSSLISTLAISLAVGAFLAYLLSDVVVVVMHRSLNFDFILGLYAISWIVVFSMTWTQKDARSRRRMLKIRMTEQGRAHARRSLGAQLVQSAAEASEDDRIEA